MAVFKMKRAISGINANTKGIVLDGKTITTTDAPWIKELRKLPKAQCEEVLPATPE